MSTDLALDIQGLTVSYRVGGREVPALHGASLTVARGEVVALVGESGSGKTTLGMASIGLLAPNAQAEVESLTIGGVQMDGWRDPLWSDIRGNQVALIPQDPAVSLNPVRRIGSQMIENLVKHGLASRSQAKARALEALERVGIDRPAIRSRQYPHELSGGQQQRVLIAMAFSSNPGLIVADEPTSGLDVTVQRAVLGQLDSLRADHGTAVLFITHDLAVAAERADRILVMQRGDVVEQGEIAAVLANPQHGYTRRLLSSAPSFTSERFAPATTPAPAAFVPSEEALLVVNNVSKTFKQGHDRVRAVNDVSLTVRAGSTVAVVGESGSGKSTLARLIVALERADSGQILLGGAQIPDRGFKALRALHRRVQLVYQNPYTSLNPRLSVADSIAEPLRNYEDLGRNEIEARVTEALDEVSLPATYASRRPIELSGGERQRVCIARGLILHPELLVLDEPVSSLDVSVQAQVLQLLVDLQERHGLTYLFISHDLAVVRLLSDRVIVLAHGQVVEEGDTREVFGAPASEYTQRLVDAIPGRGLSTTPEPLQLALAKGDSQ